MAEDGGGFDFEALDDDSSQLSALVTATPSSSVAGEEGDGSAPLIIEREGAHSAATVKALATSLSSLCPQFITVLSDFGETEKFVIEGDSLLLHVFSDPALDFSHGGQFLHLTFVVETFLFELIKRGAHFCVVFFASHKAIWQAHGAKCVARSLLIRHLRNCLPATHTTSVETFESPVCDEWIDFFNVYLPCLVMVSDELPMVAGAQISPVRGFLVDMVVAGVNVMLLCDIETLDHQLRGYYLPGRGSSVKFQVGVAKSLCEEIASVDGAAIESFVVEGGAAAALEKDWALVAMSWACGKWMQDSQTTQEDQIAAVKLVVLHAVLLKRGGIPLAHRAHMLCLSGDIMSEFQKIVVGVLNGIMKVLADSAWCKNEAAVFGTVLDTRTACDFVDARLLLSLAAAAEACTSCTAETLGLDSDSHAEAAAAWKSAVPQSLAELLPLHVPGGKVQDLQTLPLPKSGDAHMLHEIASDTLLGGILEPMGALQVKCQDGGGNVASSIAGGRLIEKGWKIEDVLPSFIWTHCRDQNATEQPSNVRSMSDWERRKLARRKARQNQMYFRYLHDYAASLTGTTVLGATSISANVESSETDSHTSERTEDGSMQDAEQEEKSDKGGKGVKGGKEKKPKEKKLSKKEQLLLDIAAKKAKGTENKLEGEWKELLKSIQSSTNAVAKMKDLDDFCKRCLKEKQDKLAMQVALERLRECREAWADDREGHHSNMKFAILTMENVRTMITVHEESLRDVKFKPSEEARIEVVQTMIQLGFIDAAMQVSAWLLDNKDKVARQELDEEVKDMARTMRNKLSVYAKSSPQFQLEHMGHLLPRPPPKVKDARITTFTPDEWQCKLLDVVDNRESALVCAPTSSGKTFISYYCMEKVMRDQTYKDGILIFVAPTKALINQIAAQVYGSFHSSFGIFTDAYRHRALTCRILVTVPECLETLLLSPENATWAQRIRYIILDEVHCISSSEEGRLWERVLLLANAPFLALSATVGEPEYFVEWLQTIKDMQKLSDAGQDRESYKVTLVQHNERWVDLRRHVYDDSLLDDETDLSPDSMVKWSKLHTRPRVDHTSAQVDGADLLNTLHPLASFTEDQLRLAKIPDNLKFEPKDSLALFEAMQNVVKRAKDGETIKARANVLETLNPAVFFTKQLQFITKPESIAFEKAVKDELMEWLHLGMQTYTVKVLTALGNTLQGSNDHDDADDDDENSKTKERGANSLTRRLFKLCGTLHRQDRLPAVIFNFDRATCEKLAFGFNEILSKAEEVQREEHAKDLKQTAKQQDQKAKMEKRARDKVLSEKKEEQMLQEIADMGGDTIEVTSIDEATFKSQFTFVQEGRSSAQDFDRITESARKVMGENHPMIQILRRGIGVHHSGLQNKYRMAVEMLFRCGYLRIVLSTETLAFGINMPCRSVIFAGDHVSLNSIQYQQMSGRAGRRGLDVLGHIVFFDVPLHKLHRLIVAPVPRLRGHFPLSSSLLLRVLAFQKQVPKVKGAKKDVVDACHNAIMRSLQHPLCHSAKPQLKAVLPVHIRYLADMLIASNVVDTAGAPTPFSTLANHLHLAEPCNLGLLAVLESGALHDLCTVSNDRNLDAVAQDLLAVLASLFSRERIHPDRAGDGALLGRARGSVVQPDLSPKCQAALDEYNARILRIGNAMAIAAAALVPSSESLPLSGVCFSGEGAASGPAQLAEAAAGAPPLVCAPFAAISGKGSDFSSVHELLSAARPELGLHVNLFPNVESRRRCGGKVHLAALAVDFYNTEALNVVCSEVGISSGVAWQSLRTLQLILGSLSKAMLVMAPPDDPVAIAVVYLETKYSEKFFSKLYK